MYPYFTNYNNLGLIYLSLGDYPKAKEAYLNALKFGDYYLIYENLGGLTLVTGDPNENIDFLTRTLKKFSQDPKIWLYLAIVEYRQQNVKEARVAIANAFYYDPNVTSTTVYNDIMSGKPLNIIFTIKP
jgi:tetratricopeptide (TPR) repeat protein